MITSIQKEHETSRKVGSVLLFIGIILIVFGTIGTIWSLVS